MELQTVGTTYPGFLYRRQPRNVYWETTISCDLACQHCRASAIPHRDPGELTTEEGKALMRSVQELGSMLVLTGGDPLKRPDINELIEYGRSLPIHVSITPSTTPLLQRETVDRFHELGISAMGVSLDGPTAEIHDAFPQRAGYVRVLDARRSRVGARVRHPRAGQYDDHRAHPSARAGDVRALARHGGATGSPMEPFLAGSGRPREAELSTPSADDVEKLFEMGLLDLRAKPRSASARPRPRTTAAIGFSRSSPRACHSKTSKGAPGRCRLASATETA